MCISWGCITSVLGFENISNAGRHTSLERHAVVAQNLRRKGRKTSVKNHCWLLVGGLILRQIDEVQVGWIGEAEIAAVKGRETASLKRQKKRCEPTRIANTGQANDRDNCCKRQ
jgi:hypothetical protein